MGSSPRLAVAVAALLTFACPSPGGSDGGDDGGGGGAGGSGGGGGPCVPNAPCVPANPCNEGLQLCVVIAQCGDTGRPLPLGTPCGPGFVCDAPGHCSGSVTLRKVGGDGQQVMPLQPFPAPLVVELVDQNGAAVAGQRIDFTPGQGTVLSAAAATTDAAGRVSISARSGLRAPAVRASGPMNTSVTFSLTQAIDAGVVFDLVGEDRDAGRDGDGLLGPLGHVGEVRGLAWDVFGEALYFADDCAVRLLDRDGFLSTVAGDGTCGNTGDGAAATSARLDRPTGLAYDFLGNRLFIADTNNDRVRVLSFDGGTLDTFAGGGTATGPDWGDDGGARQAVLSRPGWLALDTGARTLFIADTGHDRVRRVDLTTGAVSTVLAPSPSCARTAAFQGCGGELGCSLLWLGSASSGNLFVAGNLCGSRIGGPAPGVLRLDPYGVLVEIVGRSGGARFGEGEGRSLGFAAPPLISGSGTRVAMADPAGSRVWSVDANTGRVSAVLGDGVAGTAGTYVAGTSARVGRPSGLAVQREGSLVVADADGHSVRKLQTVAALPSALTLTRVPAATEATWPMQAGAVPFRATATIGSTPVSGLTIDWLPAVTNSPCRGVPLSSQTDASGTASTLGRAGADSCDLAAWVKSWPPFTPVTGYAKTVNPLPAGTIATWVNERGLATESGLPDLGVVATLPAPRGISSGFFTSGCAVRWIDSRGWVKNVAGDPLSCGFSGDGAQAATALLNNPGSVALLGGSLLLIADSGNDRIRQVDLTTGIISTRAGGGTGSPAADGDGLPATQAILSRPEHLAVSGSDLYIADNGHNRIRRVDLNTGTIQAFLGPTSCNGKQIAFAGCTGARSCAMASSGFGIYLAATICGSSPAGTTTGIIDVSGSGTLFHVAGRAGGSTADGTLATQLGLSGDLALCGSPGVLFAETSGHRLRRIDSFSGTVSTVAGTGAAGFSGDYGPATSAQLSSPGGVECWGVGAFIADTGNNAIRYVRF